MSDWLTRFKQVHPEVAHRGHDPKFGPVYVRGAGARLWDTQDKDYIDLTCGYSAANFGQAFPPLIEAATRQLNRLTHVTGEPHVGRIELAEELLALFPHPRGPSQLLFNTTGARAVETACKAALAFRPGKIMTLGPCFHGRSMATSALGDTRTFAWQQAFASQVEFWPERSYPYCGNCPCDLEFPACHLKCVDDLWRVIEQLGDKLSAVLVEPVIGARGYIFPPAILFQRLREITERLGIVLIADEIQTGLGRCGHLSMAVGQGWIPDLWVFGKSLTGGVSPLSAVVGRADLLQSLPSGSESETYAASPLAVAVAREVLAQLRAGPWLDRGRQLGETLREFAREQLRQTGWTGCGVEGVGACCVIEFARCTAADGRQLCRRFVESCLASRVLTHFTGPQSTRSVWLPPLTMSPEELAAALQRLQRAFAEAATSTVEPASDSIDTASQTIDTASQIIDTASQTIDTARR